MSKTTEVPTDALAPVWPKAFTWRGIDVVIDDPKTWPLKVLRAFEVGHVLDALAGVLGPRVWTQIENFSAEQADELFNKITELTAVGDTPGE